MEDVINEFLVPGTHKPAHFELPPSLPLPLSISQLTPDLFPAAPLILITTDSILVNDKVVARLANREVEPSYKQGGSPANYLLSQMLRELKGPESPRVRYPSKDERTWPRNIFIAADPSTSYRVLTEVVYTSGQAKFDQHLLLGRDHAHRIVVTMLTNPTITPRYENPWPPRNECFVFLAEKDLSIHAVHWSDDSERATRHSGDIVFSPCEAKRPTTFAADDKVKLKDVMSVLDAIFQQSCDEGRGGFWIAAGASE